MKTIIALFKLSCMLVVTAALTTGCAAPPGPLAPLSVSQLIQKTSSLPKYTSLRAGGRITYNDGRAKNSAIITVLLKLPDHMRVDIVGPFGISLASMAVAGGKGTAWFPHEGVAIHFHGQTIPWLGGVSLKVSDLLAVMSPATLDTTQGRSQAQVWGRRYMVRTDLTESLHEWWLAPSPLRVVEEMVYDSKGVSLWHRTLTANKGVMVPSEIDFFMGSSSSHISFSSFAIDPLLGKAQFEIRLPPDAKEVTIP